MRHICDLYGLPASKKRKRELEREDPRLEDMMFDEYDFGPQKASKKWSSKKKR